MPPGAPSPTAHAAWQIKADIDSGALDFSEAAMRFSTCSSASQGAGAEMRTPRQSRSLHSGKTNPRVLVHTRSNM